MCELMQPCGLPLWHGFQSAEQTTYVGSAQHDPPPPLFFFFRWGSCLSIDRCWGWLWLLSCLIFVALFLCVRHNLQEGNAVCVCVCLQTQTNGVTNIVRCDTIRYNTIQYIAQHGRRKSWLSLLCAFPAGAIQSFQMHGRPSVCSVQVFGLALNRRGDAFRGVFGGGMPPLCVSRAAEPCAPSREVAGAAL